MRLTIALAAAAAALAFAAPAVAQYQLGPAARADRVVTVQPRTPTRPRFVAEAVSFRAHNETGLDRAGSDEVYAVFQDQSGQHRFTSTFGDIDSGDTQTIPRRERCIAPIEYAGYDSAGFPPATWGCLSPGEAGGLAFTITLYERDGWSPVACAGAPGQPAYKKNCDDDAIAAFEHRFSPSRLLALMPNVGDTHFVTTPQRGGYDFTFRLRRLANAADPTPVLQ